jgi:hypothetical protein
MKQLKPSTIWIAEALGYRGGRRTGIALTDDSSLPILGKLLKTKNMESPCINDTSEMTATQIWSMLESQTVPEIPFLWNIFPFHPYNNGNQISNRPLKSEELTATEDIIHTLFDFFKFQQILAVGKKSFHRLQKLGYEPMYIRHPSHGGSKQFRDQMQRVYNN